MNYYILYKTNKKLLKIVHLRVLVFLCTKHFNKLLYILYKTNKKNGHLSVLVFLFTIIIAVVITYTMVIYFLILMDHCIVLVNDILLVIF